VPGGVLLRGETVELRRVTREDIDFIADGRNDPRVRGPFPDPTPPSRHDLSETFAERFATDDSLTLLVCPVADGIDGSTGDDTDDPAGMVTLMRIDETHGTAELGYWIAPDHRGEGYATAASRLLLTCAFEERRLERVAAKALAPNEPSRAVLERLAFVEEGCERSAFVRDGERVDRVTYWVLADEFDP
jgi:RimJ/RimL family protein N-acetyltransferase